MSAVDAADLVAGSWTVVRTLPALEYTIAQLAAGDHGVWVNSTTDGWRARDAVWRYEDDGTLGASVTGGGWGGEPSAPLLRDVDHDGLDDLLINADTHARFVVTGAQLALGGDISLCDAAYQFTHDADGAWFADDVVPPSALTPDTTFDPAAAALVLFTEDLSADVTPLFAGTFGTASVWGFTSGTLLRWYTLPPGPVTSTEDLGDTFYVPGESNREDGAWLDYAVGGDEPDLIVHLADADWEYGFYAIDGADPTERIQIAPTVPHANDLWDWEAGQGPDVLRTDASSLWLRYRTDAVLRYQLELVFARAE